MTGGVSRSEYLEMAGVRPSLGKAGNELATFSADQTQECING